MKTLMASFAASPFPRFRLMLLALHLSCLSLGFHQGLLCGDGFFSGVFCTVASWRTVSKRVVVVSMSVGVFEVSVGRLLRICR